MTLNDLALNMTAILPVAVLIGWACLLLVIDLFIPKDRKSWTALLAAAGLIVSLGMTVAQAGANQTGFSGMIIQDGYSTFLHVLFLVSGLLGIAVAYNYLNRLQMDQGEYYVLLLLSISGMMLMAQAGDLIMVFLALELLSIPLYVLAGFAYPHLDSQEASVKYFLLGAFSTGIVVYGTALTYGATGTTRLMQIVELVSSGDVNVTLLLVGGAMVLAGLGFKVAAVPFHMWTPDVYQGAPTAVTAFMAIGAKAGGFAALIRILVLAFPAVQEDLSPLIWGVAAATMILGNVVAIAQSNIKRMLAYSSIAHAGYVLMALVPYGQAEVSADGVAGALFYLVAYGLTSFAAWAVVMALEQAEERGLQLEDYAGLGAKYPLLAACMAIAMLSFTGVPPTLGFVGKFYIFRTALEGGYIGLALIGVLTSLISAYYYLRVIVIMYMRDGEPVVLREPLLYFTAVASAVGVVLLTIFSGPLFNWAERAVGLF